MTRPHALLIVLTVLCGGCTTTPPQAKPSVPPGVVAPDPKPANDALAAADAFSNGFSNGFQ